MDTDKDIPIYRIEVMMGYTKTENITFISDICYNYETMEKATRSKRN